jgi:hypothetical protein
MPKLDRMGRKPDTPVRPTQTIERNNDDLFSQDLRLPTEYPLGEILNIYAKRLGVLLTSSVMIIGIGLISIWFSILLIPTLYLASTKFKEIFRRRLKDSILSSVVLLLGLSLTSIFDLGFFASAFVYLLVLAIIIFIFSSD